MGKSYQYSESNAHNGGVHAVRVGCKSSSLLVSCGSDSKVHVWAVSQINQPIVTVDLDGCDAEVATFDPSEEHMLVGTSTGSVQLWELNEQTQLREFNARASACSSIDHHPFGEFFCVGYEDGSLILWDIQETSPVQSYAGHGDRITCIRFSPDGRWIASACTHGVVKLWDLMAHKQLHCFEDHTADVTYLAFSPNDLLLASCSSDGHVHLYELDTFSVAASIDTCASDEQADVAGVQAVTFSHGSNVILVALSNQLRAWSLDNEPSELVAVTDLAWGPVYDLVLSDDLLVAACCHGDKIGVALVDGLNKLVHPPHVGQRVRGVNTAEAGPAAIRRLMHGSTAGSTAGSAPNSPRNLPRTPMSSSMGRSPSKGSTEQSSRLKGPSSTTRGGAGFLRSSAPESDINMIGSDMRRGGRGNKGGASALSVSVDASTTRGDALGSRGVARRSVLDNSPLSAVCGVDSPLSALQSLNVGDPSPAGPEAASRSPCRKAITQRGMQQRQSRGVLDAVFHSEPVEENVRSPRASHLGAADRMAVNPSLLRPGERQASSQSANSKLSEVPPLEEVLPPKLPARPRCEVDSFSAYLDASEGLSQGRSRPSSMERLPEGADFLDRLLEGQGNLTDDHHPAESLANMEEQMMDAALRKHSAVVSALRNRLTNYETVKLFWSNGDLRGVMSAMKLDLSVAADVLDSFRSSKDFLGLDVCTEAINLAVELLENATNDKYLSVALDVLATYVRGYGQLIREYSSQDMDVMHRDMEYEFQREQCFACRTALQAALPFLAAVTQHDDANLGRKAQELEDDVVALTSPC